MAHSSRIKQFSANLRAPAKVGKCLSGKVWRRDELDAIIQLNPWSGALPTDSVVFPALRTEGAGSKFFIDPTQPALRAGRVTGDEWDVRGADSVAFGLDTEASGDQSMALGTGSVASETGALVWSDGLIPRSSANPDEATFGATGGFRVHAGGASTPAYSSGQIYFDAVETVVTGKLTVVGIIDPTGLVVEGQVFVPGGIPDTGYGTYWCTSATPTLPIYTDNQGASLVLNTTSLEDLGAFVNSAGLTRSKTTAALTDSMLFGAQQVDSSGVVAEQKRWLFYRQTVGAFRAGKVTSTEWDVTNLGDYSAAFGANTIASGASSYSHGLSCVAAGSASFAMGNASRAVHDYSLVWSDSTDSLSSLNAEEVTLGCSGGFRVLGAATAGYVPGQTFLDSPETVATGRFVAGAVNADVLVATGAATTPVASDVIWNKTGTDTFYYTNDVGGQYPLVSPFQLVIAANNNVIRLNPNHPDFQGYASQLYLDSFRVRLRYSVINVSFTTSGAGNSTSLGDSIVGSYSFACGVAALNGLSYSVIFNDAVRRSHPRSGATFAVTGGLFLQGGNLVMTRGLTQTSVADTVPGGAPSVGKAVWWSFDQGGSFPQVPVFTDALGNERLLGQSSFYNSGTVTLANPTAPYYAAGNSFVFGATSLEETGAQLQFDATQASFRAGSVDSTQWVDRGAGSCALGVNTTASANGAFALGNGSTAADANSLVWSDATSRSSLTSDSVTIGASGGMRVLTDVGGTTGVALAPSGTAWAAVSDRDRKENLREFTGVLERVLDLPIYEYNYIGQKSSRVCVGPMAQDWHRLFPSAKDPLRIDTMDLDGVKLAAIRELATRVRRIQAAVSKMSGL